MRTIKLLLCDDEQDYCRSLQLHFVKEWPTLLKEKLVFDVCLDISDAEKPLNEVGSYDALLLDIFWGDIPHGVDLCRVVRERFPELPIIILSHAPTVEHLQTFIKLGISAFLSKSEKTLSTWCAEVNNVLNQSSIARAARPLYHKIRELRGDKAAWKASVVNEAASQVWRQENAYDKWNYFWDEFGNELATSRLKMPVDLLKNFFAESNLFNFGVVPSIRGHLEHVLYVYFTGYVVSHKLPFFRKAVCDAAKRLLGSYEPAKNDLYWEMFQIAWLVTATLHDTGYSLELVSDLHSKCNGIEKLFTFAEIPKLVPQSLNSSINWKLAPHAESAFQRIPQLLRYKTLNSTWIIEHATFPDKTNTSRINHGVASGILFLEKVHKDCLILVNENPELMVFLEWATTAMALHSLKRPGSVDGVKLDIETDPLSCLLLLCDELQVWDRERPDASQKQFPFRRTELSGLEIGDNLIAASVSYVPYVGVTPSRKDHFEPLAKCILEDNNMLIKYLSLKPMRMEISSSILGTEFDFPKLCVS
jgi:DNA-binding NarL/FixJ family response regulator